MASLTQQVGTVPHGEAGRRLLPKGTFSHLLVESDVQPILASKVGYLILVELGSGPITATYRVFMPGDQEPQGHDRFLGDDAGEGFERSRNHRVPPDTETRHRKLVS